MGEGSKLPQWKATDPLWSIATSLRQANFDSQVQAGQHFGLADTTIGRYEAYDPGGAGLKPPFGYLAALAQLLGQRITGEPTLVDEKRQHLAQQMEQVRKRFYAEQPRPQIRTWEDLGRAAAAYQSQRSARQRTEPPEAGSSRRDSEEQRPNQLSPQTGGGTYTSQANAVVSISMAPTPSAPGSAPPLPTLLLGRDEDLRQLKARLGLAEPQAAGAAVHVLTAMRGWPGVGKTTLAAALAHEPDIADIFPDGVLWTSLGQQPSLFAELTAWGRALGSAEVERTRSIEEASAYLAGLLREQRRLLIVDDAWDALHVQPFRVGGRHCALLVTTRLPEVARAVAPTPGDIYLLDVLSDEAALELLRALAPEVEAKEPQASQALVQELEGLPLAIQVAGRLLHTEASYGFTVATLLDEIRAGARLLQAQAPPDRAEVRTGTIPTVAVLLRRSTDRLDENSRTCLAYLGVFAPKPATFDAAALQAVWQVEDPNPIIRILVDRGLLEPIRPGRFWMHALLVDHARSLLMNSHTASV